MSGFLSDLLQRTGTTSPIHVCGILAGGEKWSSESLQPENLAGVF